MIEMNKETKNKLIADFKKEFRIKDNAMIGSVEKYEGKKEMMEIIFTKSEVLRFENEVRVLDIPAAIEEMAAFESKLDEYKIVGMIHFDWTVDWIEEMYDIYKRDAELKNELEEFNKLYERALKITKKPFIVVKENSKLTNLDLLSIGSQIKIESRNAKTFGCLLNKTNFQVGKAYKVVSRGDGFGLVDESEYFYHIDEVESYYYTKLKQLNNLTNRVN